MNVLPIHVYNSANIMRYTRLFILHNIIGEIGVRCTTRSILEIYTKKTMRVIYMSMSMFALKSPNPNSDYFFFFKQHFKQNFFGAF